MRRAQARGRVVVALLLAAWTTTASVGPPVAAAEQEQAPPARIAWGADGRLWLADADGGQPHDTGIAGALPAWSPDGATLAFRSPGDSYATAFADVWVSEPDGPPQRVAATAPGRGAVRWAPDGRALAFAEATAEGGALRVLEVASGQVRTLATSSDADGQPGHPRWSANGSQVAFLRSRGTQADLLVVPADGGEARVLVDGRDGFGVTGFDWAADGSALVFTYRGEVQSIGLDGSGRRTLAALDGMDATDPAAAPDGVQVAFALNPSGDGRTLDERDAHPASGVYTVTMAGQGLRQLGTVTEGAEAGPTWTPDARRIVFRADTDDSGCHCRFGALWMVDADGGGLTRRPDPSGNADLTGPAVAPGVTRRAAGPSRVETAVASARLRFDAADTVVVARADAYPDALSGAPLAAQLGAPVLLTGSQRLHPSVAAELARLGATRAVLLGSRTALAAQVEEDLRAAGVDDIERIGGADRFATAAAVAGQVGGTEVFVVEGASADPARGWPDAVAVSGLAAFTGAPLLLVTREQLPEATRQALADLGVTDATIVGSTAAVSATVEQAIRAEGVATTRLAGRTRYETSVAVADAAAAAGADPTVVWLATGRNWPDALAAGPLAARDRGVLLLVDGHDLDASPPARTWLQQHPPAQAVLTGGPDVLRPMVAVAVERLADP